jgi:hypothetical protein
MRSAPRSRKERNSAAVHNDIAKIVESGAKKITKAVIEQAMAGQLEPAKYLLAMAQILPKATDGSCTTADEEEDLPKAATSGEACDKAGG